MEIDGVYFWVYFEVLILVDLEVVMFLYDVFCDVWLEQVNWVNVECDEMVQSVLFD